MWHCQMAESWSLTSDSSIQNSFVWHTWSRVYESSWPGKGHAEACCSHGCTAATVAPLSTRSAGVHWVSHAIV